MIISTVINSIGLVCDIIGAVLIWRYGLPESIDRKGAVHLILGETDEAEKVKAERYDCITRCGIILLVGGFVLQLISNFI